MLITEEEAGGKWCPHVRIARSEIVEHESDESVGGGLFIVSPEVRTIVAGCNTDALGGLRVPGSCRCIASGCAMWRFASVEDPYWQRPARPPESLQPAPLIKSDRGYCGLAGKP